MATYNPNSPYSDFLETNPNILYGGFLANQQGRSRNFLDYWTQQYNRQYQDYLGQLGKQALNGQSPSLNFGDYLNNYDFGKQWNSLSPWTRGLSNLTSRVNWNV